MPLLVVNADDLGLSPGVNDGIMAAHAARVVTSASLMVNRPGAEHAAAAAREHPELSVGLHFEDDTLAGLEGRAVAKRFEIQLERFRALMEAHPTHAHSICADPTHAHPTRTDPTHLDSHHHVHYPYLELFLALAAPLGVPVRHAGRFTYVGDFYGRDDAGAPAPERIRRPFLLELATAAAGRPATELGCHPGRVLGDFASSYLEERAVELATLTEPGLREEIEARGVTLVGFAEA